MVYSVPGLNMHESGVSQSLLARMETKARKGDSFSEVTQADSDQQDQQSGREITWPPSHRHRRDTSVLKATSLL